MDKGCEDKVRSLFHRWGKWAKRDGLNKLWFMNCSINPNRGKFHEGDNPVEERIDRVVSELYSFHPLAREVVYLYYVYEDPELGKLGWPDVQKKLQCSRSAVEQAHKFALGFVAGSVNLELAA